MKFDQMTILNDIEIAELCKEKNMISPFVHEQVRIENNNKIVSYGLSSFGYDVRLAPIYKVFTNHNADIIDPLNMPTDCYIDKSGSYCVIPPNNYLLSHTIETFNIPDDIMVLCVGKSTWSRCGIAINVTPIEAGFKGTVVIEIANLTPVPIKIYANMGIAQFMFFRGNKCGVSYDDRNGKYQNQKGIVTAKI